ncbi:MAG: cation-transporting P-type ATPase [Pseudomonadales bacterium]|nr:cation-transporting P-type ATPase [Pseudomonadales bacterium]
MTKYIFHSVPVNALLSYLDTSIKKGLSENQVNKKLSEFGNNEIDEQEKVYWWQKLLAQFNNYLVWILIVGAIISIIAGEIIDGVLIIAIILFMAILGYVQDAKAEESLKNLKKLESRSTQVRRNGELQIIDTKNLVIGDIVILKAGDAVPADIRIIESNNVSIDESTLTGESMPSSKRADELKEDTPLAERTNMAYSGTLVIEGKLTAIVVATGMNTELGKIATLLQDTQSEPTPLEEQLEKLGKLLSSILIGMVLIVLFLNVFVRGENLLEAILEAVALAIAAVPEGLPAVITICLAFGTQAMVKKQALVRKLKAVEALGSISVILTDKTGTLTTGKMSVTQTWTTDQLDGKNMKKTSPLLGRLMRVAKLCNTNSNPTDSALFDWVKKSAINLPDIQQIFEFEFNSSLKRMSTVHSFSKIIGSKQDQEKHLKLLPHPNSHTYLIATKGAPEVLLNHTTHYFTSDQKIERINKSQKEKIESQLLEMTSKGLRVIALAEKTMEKFSSKTHRDKAESNLILIGLVGLSDPAKEEVPHAIALTKAAGIRPIMITGDNPITAKSIGLMIGLITKDESLSEDAVMTGDQLDEAIEKKQVNRILNANIFARVSPSHKSYIVDLFQESGYLVAMVGDGVNDAPSIKAAHVGVAMGQRGSDVTKSAADLVLLDDNYKTLVDAIEEGRYILHRIRLFVGYLLSCNMAEIGIFVVATIIGVPVPLTAIMLLLLNIVSDAAPAIAMSREPGDPTLMNLPPRNKDESIVTKQMWLNIASMTIIATFAVMISYFIGFKTSTAMAQTMAFVTLSMLELLRAFTARSLDKSIFKLGFTNNKWIPYSVLFGTLVTLAVVYLGNDIFKTTHLSFELLTLAIGLAFIGPVTEEILKPLIVKKA